MTISYRLSCLALICAAGCLASRATDCLAVQTIGAEPPATSAPINAPAPQTSPPAAPGAITTADDLLRALEKADANLKTLQADLRLTEQKGELLGFDRVVYLGKLFFISEAPSEPQTQAKLDPPTFPPPLINPIPAKEAKGRRMFQVTFEASEIDNSRHVESKSIIFDGRWLVERNATIKQIIKQAVVPPGQTIDPLAIGEGPFPLPIGQKRERILDRFDAQMPAPDDSFPTPPNAPADAPKPDWLKDTYQLLLTPKRGTDEARQYLWVRIWYRKSDLIPQMALTKHKDDATTEVFLTKIKLNDPLPPGVFDTTCPPGWDMDTKEFRRPKADD